MDPLCTNTLLLNPYIYPHIPNHAKYISQTVVVMDSEFQFEVAENVWIYRAGKNVVAMLTHLGGVITVI